MNCPHCGARVDDEGLAACPTCGAPLDRDDAYQAKKLSDAREVMRDAVRKGLRKAVRRLILIFLGLLIVGGVVLVAVLVPAMREAKSKAGRATCSNSLRQLGAAAIQYATDKRFFPHVRPLAELDGDVDTRDTPKVIRALLWYGYLDNPESTVCPESSDAFVPTAGGDMRLWFWGGEVNPSGGGQSPFVDGANDPRLSQTRELSYGWTRKGMNDAMRSTAILSADRAVRDGVDTGVLAGNHESGWNVLRVDSAVGFESVSQDPFPGALLPATQGEGAGYLSVRVQDDPTVFR